MKWQPTKKLSFRSNKGRNGQEKKKYRWIDETTGGQKCKNANRKHSLEDEPSGRLSRELLGFLKPFGGEGLDVVVELLLRHSPVENLGSDFSQKGLDTVVDVGCLLITLNDYP